MKMMKAKIKHRMTEFGEKILRELFLERIEIMNSHVQIKMKKQLLVAENSDELFWVWLEYVKNIGSNKNEGENHD